MRNYEIPYLGKSALPLENQIVLQDLFVSVQNNRIILRSKKLDKEIIPRLSTAHNYSVNALPVYQFLCDLQTQYVEKAALGFNWGRLSESYQFLPRAVYKNVILARAKWQLSKDDIAVLLKEGDPFYLNNISAWRNELMIPPKVVLADGDNELLVNFEDKLSIRMLVATIKNRERIVLKEFLYEPGDCIIQDAEGNGYANEFIAILLKDNEHPMSENGGLTKENLVTSIAGADVQRNYTIGSDWLYYKLYAGVKTADKLLADVIQPLTEKLLSNKLIDQFFFIRYGDPEHHLRLRFHLADNDKLGIVIKEVHEIMQPFIEQRLISKIQTDTYIRELERYGNESMELSEYFFFIDSTVTLQLLNLIEGEEGEILRWQFAVRSIDDLLTDFKIRHDGYEIH